MPSETRSKPNMNRTFLWALDPKVFKPLTLCDECKISRYTGSYLLEIHSAEHSRHGADYSRYNFGAEMDNDADMALFDNYFYMVNQRRDIVSVCLAGL